MDEIAEICGISSAEIRKINGLKQGSITASGQKLTEHKVSLSEVIDKTIKKSNYNKKINEYKKLNNENVRFQYGIGLSCSFRGCSLGAEGTDATSAIVSVQADSSVYIHAGLNENGQGMKTAFSQITAEVLGINLNKIVFLEPQTATVTDGGPTVASRATLTGGNAVKDAAEQVKSNIFSIIKDELQVSKINETVWVKGFISRKKNKRDIKPINFEEAAEKAYLAGVNLSAYGWFKAPHVDWDEKTGQGTAYFTYVYGCHVAEIKIDTSTGKIDILKVTATHDVGRVINKLGAEGQVYGGVAQGIGYAILEDYNIQNGVVKSTNFDEYLIPTVKDINKIEPIFIENPDKYGPYGAKSLGEPTLELTSAAINNALKFATGKHSYEIPLTLEKVYLGKNLKKPSRQSHITIDESCHSYEIKKQTPRITNVKTYTPKDLNETLESLSKDKYKILAGGTDVLIELRRKTGSHKLLNINPLQELKKISITNKEITIGSAVTFSKILENQHIRKNFPLLIKACCLIGSKQIRNRGTIGGNIVNAAPCADSYPPLIIYEAKFILKSKKEKREIQAKDFIIKNYKTQIKPDEILTEIILLTPEKKKYYNSYFKLGRRNAMNITRMSVGIQIAFDKKDLIEECKIVSGSLFNRPKRITKIENILVEKKLDNSSIKEIEKPLRQIINDAIGTRWSAEYKIPVFINMVKNSLFDIMRQKEVK
jgi:CO/xanthine dehydrogenase FAD-binding subunit